MPRLKFKWRININASQQAVYDYVSDFTRHGEWSDGLKVEAISDGPLAVGSEFRSVGKQFGKDAENSVKIVEYDPPNRLGFTSSDGKFDFLNEMSFQSQNGGTVLERHLTFDATPAIAIAFKLFIGPFFAGPSMNKTLKNLKEKVEQSAS